jgi:uncharacterized membrane protein
MKITYSLSNRYLIVLNSFLFVAYWIMMIFYYTTLPDTIPVHFDSSGDATRFTEKSIGAWFLAPFIVSLTGLHTIFIFSALIAAGVESWNYPEKKRIMALSSEKQKYFKRILKWFANHLLHSSILLLLVIFMTIGMYSYFYASNTGTFPLTPVLILMIFLYLVYIIQQYLQLKKNFRKELKLYHSESLSTD